MVKQVNLLSRREASSEQSIGIWVLLGVFIVGLAGFVGFQQLNFSAKQEEIAKNQEALAAAQKDLKDKRRAAGFQDADALAAEISNLRAKIASNQGLLAQIRGGGLGSQTGHTDLFELLGRNAEAGVWLTSLDVSNSRKSISLSGRALSSESVMKYSRRLNTALKGRSEEFRFTGVEINRADIAAPATLQDPRPARVSTVRFTLN